MIVVVRSALLAAAAMLVLSVSANAATDVSGTVSVTGAVTSKCSANGNNSGSTFSGTIPLGELEDPSTGRISPTLTGANISGASQSFTIVCNTLQPSVTLSATPLGDGVAAPTTYTSTVDYTAALALAETSGSETFTYGTHGLPAATTGTLAHPISSTPNNVTVSVNSLETDGGANTSVLTAGSYGSAAGGTGGVISIVISP